MNQYDDSYDEDAGGETTERDDIKRLRTKAKAADEWQKRAEAAERKLLSSEVGLPKTKLADLFMNSYTGEMTVEAIRAAAIEVELIKDGDVASSTASADERAAHDRVAKAAAGTPGDSAFAEYQSQIRNAKSAEEVAAIVRQHGGQVSGVDY